MKWKTCPCLQGTVKMKNKTWIQKRAQTAISISMNTALLQFQNNTIKEATAAAVVVVVRLLHAQGEHVLQSTRRLQRRHFLVDQILLQSLSQHPHTNQVPGRYTNENKSSKWLVLKVIAGTHITHITQTTNSHVRLHGARRRRRRLDHAMYFTLFFRSDPYSVSLLLRSNLHRTQVPTSVFVFFFFSVVAKQTTDHYRTP